jgi:hypothetical protein
MRAGESFLIMIGLMAFSCTLTAQKANKSKLEGSWTCTGISIDGNLMKYQSGHTKLTSFYSNSVYQVQNCDSTNNKLPSDIPVSGWWKVIGFGRTIKFIGTHSVSREKPIQQSEKSFKRKVIAINDSIMTLSDYLNGQEVLYHYKKISVLLPPIPDMSNAYNRAADQFKLSNGNSKPERNPKSTYKLRREIQRSKKGRVKIQKYKDTGA